MQTLLKLMIVVSLLLAPFAGHAGDAVHPSSVQSMQHMSVHDMADLHTHHDCCDAEQAQATANAQLECDNGCGDCQYHCSSSTIGLIAALQLTPNLTIYEAWPNLQAVPLSRHEGQLRPPMSA